MGTPRVGSAGRPLAFAVGALALTVPVRAAAETLPPISESDAGETPPVAESTVSRAAGDGQFLPLTYTARVAATAAVAAGYAGYDGALGAVMESHAEVRLWGPLALRGAAELGDTSRRVRPSIGARVQFLSQARHGVDGAVSVTYRAEGFTEAEGEIETLLAVARRVGAATLLANLAYGQDPEGHERDGEVRAAALARVSRRLLLGLDGRWRLDLGSEAGQLRANNEPTTDLDVGPVATLVLGPVALTAETGASLVRRIDGKEQLGVVAIAGIGTSF
jgi:hypothetical protein